MLKPEPLGPVKVVEIVAQIAERHRGDGRLSEMPEPEHPRAVVEFVLALGKKPHPRDVADALTLVRAERLELDSLELRLLQAGRRSGMSWRALGALVGIRSRAGAHKHAKRLGEEVTAARLHLPVEVIRGGTAGPVQLAELLQIARALVERWSELLTDDDIDIWYPGIVDLLETAQTRTQQVSLAAQVIDAVEEIDDLAARLQQPPASTKAALFVLQAVRGFRDRRRTAVPAPRRQQDADASD
ncbi:hypothetical protein [Streptomyces sp. NPDC058254]|uniref:hypothetical protein n=1 Tax=Streptomyces sp. NPDC058254 TaxID=3346406 RepID=UPI0036EF2103